MNCALPDDETLMGELATVRYGIKSDGKITRVRQLTTPCRQNFQ